MTTLNRTGRWMLARKPQARPIVERAQKSVEMRPVLADPEKNTSSAVVKPLCTRENCTVSSFTVRQCLLWLAGLGQEGEEAQPDRQAIREQITSQRTHFYCFRIVRFPQSGHSR